MKNIATYRFNFSSHFLNELIDFNNQNEGLNKNEFSKNWENWKNENSSLIEEERERLESIGFDSNKMNEKMRHCVRNYIPKKMSYHNDDDDDDEDNEPKPKITKKHINPRFSSSSLYLMDDFIKENIELGKRPIDLLRLFKQSVDLEEDFEYTNEQLQKTFQNRYQRIKDAY
jgi:hypothetical protein